MPICRYFRFNMSTKGITYCILPLLLLGTTVVVINQLNVYTQASATTFHKTKDVQSECAYSQQTSPGFHGEPVRSDPLHNLCQCVEECFVFLDFTYLKNSFKPLLVCPITTLFNTVDQANLRFGYYLFFSPPKY